MIDSKSSVEPTNGLKKWRRRLIVAVLGSPVLAAIIGLVAAKYAAKPAADKALTDRTGDVKQLRGEVAALRTEYETRLAQLDRERPAVFYRVSGGLDLPSKTPIKMNFDQLAYDTTHAARVTPSYWEFVAPITGIYAVQVSASVQEGAGSFVTMSLCRTITTPTGDNVIALGSAVSRSRDAYLNASTALRLDKGAGFYVEIQAEAAPNTIAPKLSSPGGSI